ncbi:MAG: TIGR02266 family protein [Deltaproteobacteria bacterium]|nr:TIGR02266 family protein [Deltaproteobacteria bacterium]MBW2444315.1 TIGR02266 family protein [Deltaproteobacteria bacterium]
MSLKHTPEPAADDRRKSPRTQAVIPVDYSTVDAFFSEFTMNINEGGMFVGTDSEHAIDTLVTLRFRLPGSEAPCEVVGRVVWLREAADEEGPRGIGIEFETLDDGTRTRINDLVRELRTQA